MGRYETIEKDELSKDLGAEVNIGTPIDGVYTNPTMNSFAPVKKTSWHNRLDPLWETSYNTMRTISWDKSSIVTRGIYDDGSGILRQSDREVYSPIDVSDAILFSQTAILSMAVLIEFQNCSTDHIMIMIGDPNVSRVKKALNMLFVAGVIKSSNLHSTINRESMDIWTINKKGDNFQKWLQGLEPWQFQLISGGRDIMSGWGTNQLSAARHNITTMDLMVKALEVSPHIIGAWGERHTHADIFAEQKLMPHEFSRANVGDGMLVTKSGTVIILESSGLTMTGRSDWSLEAQNKSAGLSRLAQKAAAWTAICGRSDIDVRIVFVDIASRPSFYKLANSVIAGVKFESSKFIANEKLRRKGQDRIYVADGRSWLPLPRLVSQQMETLACINVGKSIHTNGENKIEPMLTEEENIWNYGSPLITNTMLSLHNPEWALKK